MAALQECHKGRENVADYLHTEGGFVAETGAQPLEEQPDWRGDNQRLLSSKRNNKFFCLCVI